MCSNDVYVSVDHTVDTLMLNKRGGIELKCTVLKTAPNRYDFWVCAHDPISHNVWSFVLRFEQRKTHCLDKASKARC